LNSEGYKDKTAETAISNIYKEEKLKRKGGYKNGDKGCTKAKESKKA